MPSYHKAFRNLVGHIVQGFGFRAYRLWGLLEGAGDLVSCRVIIRVTPFGTLITNSTYNLLTESPAPSSRVGIGFRRLGSVWFTWILGFVAFGF